MRKLPNIPRGRLRLALRVLWCLAATGGLLLSSRAAWPPAPRTVRVIVRMPPAAAAPQRAIRAVSRLYHIAPVAAARILDTTWTATAQAGVDPWVMAAVIGVESRYNPWAMSRAGAVGLAQVLPRAHPGLLRGHPGGRALLRTGVNLRWGVRILARCQQRNRTLVAALQCYNGAGADPRARYAHRVLATLRRLRRWAGDRHGRTWLAAE